MSKTSFDFIKYTSKNINSGDFNGPESSLLVNEQIEFLKHYKDAFLSFSKTNFSKKIISKKEIINALSKIELEKNNFRKREYLKDGQISLLDQNEYKYLHLYGDKVEIRNKIISLINTHQYPAPSIDLVLKDEIKTLSLKLKISKTFITPLRGNVETTMMGKYIEFRNNLKDIGRIQFYSDGTVMLRQLRKDIYHYENTYLGKVEYSKNINIIINASNDGYVINVSELTAKLSSKFKINYVLFSSGQYPSGSSKILFKTVRNFNDKKIDIFTLNKQKNNIKIGTKCLPVSLGGFKNHNLSLSYLSEFNLDDDKSIYLHLSTINPGGEVFVNNKLVYRSLTFLTQDLNISNFVNKGINKIEVIAYPRSPENIISWHRNKDPYFASFIDEIYIEKRNDINFKNINIFTTNTKPIKTQSKLTINSKNEINIRIKIAIDNKIFKSKLVNLKKGDNKINISTTFSNLKLWSSENPNLYKIKYIIESNEVTVDEYIVNYGFRTISQQNGKFLYNNEEFIMKGALLMQYLPPYEEIVINHTCPSDEQILEQFLIAKKMNSNTVRMHILGYGNNEKRYARIADYLGINLIWTTSYIDSLSTVIFNGTWKQKGYYLNQIDNIINNPSVIAYEGLNEMGLTVNDISLMYKEFVNAIKKVDKSRLLFPISHPYYGGDSYQRGGNCGYIQDDGLNDESFNRVNVYKEWNDKLVVRSAHTYNWLLGYGSTWEQLRKQSWSGQSPLLKSNNHAFVVSEFAVIGRINPMLHQSGDFYNDKSYEYSNEYDLGYDFSKDYSLSQTYQALSAKYDCIKMLSLDVDGLLWCSLISGANDGSYLKPIIDFNYYPKYAFETLKQCYAPLFIADNSTDVVWDEKHILKPTLFGIPDFKKHNICVEILDSKNNIVFSQCFKNFVFDVRNKLIGEIKPILTEGYYKIVYKYN